jgi:hypothetical protein
MQDPEVNNFELADNRDKAGDCLDIAYDVRIVRSSACCSEEMKEYSFDGTIDVVVKDHFGEGHSLTLNDGDCEATENGGGRYKKSYYGFSLEGEITCSCGKEVICDTTEYVDGSSVLIRDEVAASEMDEV